MVTTCQPAGVLRACVSFFSLFRDSFHRLECEWLWLPLFMVPQNGPLFGSPFLSSLNSSIHLCIHVCQAKMRCCGPSTAIQAPVEDAWNQEFRVSAALMFVACGRQQLARTYRCWQLTMVCSRLAMGSGEPYIVVCWYLVYLTGISRSRQVSYEAYFVY